MHESQKETKMNFQGRFNLADPSVICTEEPRKFPAPDFYRVGVFNYDQAHCLFSLMINHDNIRVYAIRDDLMKVEIVTNLYQAKEFFGVSND